MLNIDLMLRVAAYRPHSTPNRNGDRDVAIVLAEDAIVGMLGDFYRSQGYRTMAPRTPLDLIQTLLSHRTKIGPVFISPRLSWSDGLREFLADEYPELDRVVVAR